MSLNEKQRKFVMVGVILFVLMGVFPPWTYTIHVESIHREKPAGYALIFSQPLTEQPDNGRFGIKIDTTRLVVQWIVLAVATSFCVLLAGSKGNIPASIDITSNRPIDYVQAFGKLCCGNKEKAIFWVVVAVGVVAGLIANPAETAKWVFIALILQVIRVYGSKKFF